jgi:hypothetical protein
MATEFLREKINALRNMVQNEALQLFQHELIVEAAVESTGDAQVDQSMRAQADNSKAAILAAKRRLSVYEPKLKEFEAELQDSQPKLPA